MKFERYSWLCALLVVLVVLAGCSSTGTGNTTASSSTSGDSSVAAESDATDAGTRMVKTAMGDIEVPANPQRVVVNWYVGDVITLGITPVAYSGWAQETMVFYDQLKDIPKIEKWEAEEIMTYDPDLIITYSPENYEKLSTIAPVLVIPEGDVKTIERLAFLGEATGHEVEAKKAIDTFNTKLDEAKQKLSSGAFKEKSFSIFEDWGRSSYGIYFETGSRGGTLLYEYLDLKKPEKLEALIAKSGEGRGSLSYEAASEYFGDYVLWFQQQDKESEYAKTEIWKSIPAVQAGHVLEIPGQYGGLFYYSDVASMTGQLDFIMDKLLQVVE